MQDRDSPELREKRLVSLTDWAFHVTASTQALERCLHITVSSLEYTYSRDLRNSMLAQSREFIQLDDVPTRFQTHLEGRQPRTQKEHDLRGGD